MKEKIKNLPAVFLISFGLNLIWELLQMGLYVDVTSFPWCCVEATFWDAVIITTVYFLMSRANKITIILLMFLIAAFIENRALEDGRWAYNSYMPLVYGLGLSPLLQLAVTTLMTFEISARAYLLRSKDC